MTLYIFGDSVEQGQITLAAMELDAMRHKVVRQMYTSSNKDNTRSYVAKCAIHARRI